jgi:hypothetical protein
MAALSTPIVSSPPSSRAAHHPAAPLESSERNHLLQRAAICDQQARESADAGDLTASARLILQALDCERRAGGLGPQVLQLIKPR